MKFFYKGTATILSSEHRNPLEQQIEKYSPDSGVGKVPL
jgi:hypothetical protein